MDDKKRALKNNEENKNKSLSEKIDDAMDDAVGGLYDAIYGEGNDFTHDIPATMPDPDNEIRHINKVQTRRNFNKRFSKYILKGFLIVFGLGILAYILLFIIGLFF